MDKLEAAFVQQAEELERPERERAAAEREVERGRMGEDLQRLIRLDTHEDVQWLLGRLGALVDAEQEKALNARLSAEERTHALHRRDFGRELTGYVERERATLLGRLQAKEKPTL